MLDPSVHTANTLLGIESKRACCESRNARSVISYEQEHEDYVYLSVTDLNDAVPP